jgi:3-oxoacyl-[acyl-carrier-protein] synthase-3
MVRTNHDLEKMVDTSHDWIVERTGIHQRHIAQDGENATSLGETAARRAMEAAGVGPEDIDMIIVATVTPDRTFPSTACLIQARLGVKGIPAFDITAACGGFVYGLSIADQFIKTGHKKRILVIGVELLSRLCDWTDRTTCILFADGAGAVVVGASEEPGILSTHIHADGSYEPLLYAPHPIADQTGDASFIHMSGNEVFKVAVRTLSQIVDETLEANGVSQDDIDWLVPHQANIRIIQATAKKLGLPMEQVVMTIDRHGNTSSASIPLALDEAVRDGRIQRGHMVMLEAFGGGFTWGSALLKY